MRTSMTFPIRFWSIVLAGLLIFQVSSEALANWNQNHNNTEVTLEASGDTTRTRP